MKIVWKSPTVSPSGLLGKEMSVGEVILSLAIEKNLDVDLACYLLNEDGQIEDQEDVVYYGNTGSYSHGLKLVNDATVDLSFDAESNIILSVEKLSNYASKLLFVASPYKNSGGLNHVGSYELVVHRKGQMIHHAKFDLSPVRNENLVVLGLFDLQNMSFNTPGIPLAGDFATLTELLERPKNPMCHASASWPNLLSPDGVGMQASFSEAVLQVAWGCDSQKMQHLRSVPSSLCSETLQQCALAWRYADITPLKNELIQELIGRGADWIATLETGNPVKNDPVSVVSALMGDIGLEYQKHWAVALLNTLDQPFLMPYVIQATPAENDVLYEHCGRPRWLLEHTSEANWDNQLSIDMGL